MHDTLLICLAEKGLSNKDKYWDGVEDHISETGKDTTRQNYDR